jgi:hypothetical protein
VDAGEDRGTFVRHARIKWVQLGVTTAGLLSRTVIGGLPRETLRANRATPSRRTAFL